MKIASRLMWKEVELMNKVDISGWKEFQISRVFRISSPASRSIKTYNEGDIPYVSSGSVNNGIISYLEPNEDEDLEKGNCITVSPLDGSSFYQEDDFLGRGGAGSAISLLYNDNLSKYNALFICTVIKIMAQKFDYSDALTSDNLKTLKINLPTQRDKKGEFIVDANKQYSDEGFIPDWDYMSSYMEEIEEKAQRRIDILNKL